MGEGELDLRDAGGNLVEVNWPDVSTLYVLASRPAADEQGEPQGYAYLADHRPLSR